MSTGTSYRQILRSSVIIGGASFINILVGLLRTKVAAVLLEPAGVGLIGLFTNVLGTASSVAGLGFGNVGTRQIAEAVGHGETGRVDAARRALFWGTLLLALIGGLVFWALRDVLATQVLGDESHGPALGWLAIGVTLSVAATSQYSLLNGMRRIGDLARVSVGSALLSTLLATTALWLLGHDGVVGFVIAAPLASFIVGVWYVARLPKITGPATPLATISRQWSMMARLGAAFMVGGLAGTVGQLFVRTLVQRELGMNALGHFQASWAISMTYIGFVLGAMGTDYYPRLTAVIHDHKSANRIVNEQTEVALLLATPVLLAMLGLAPWVITLLYSDQFGEAVETLRWQVLGDLLKVVSWPLGFILLAAGSGKTFMVAEWLGIAVFVALSWWLLPTFGLKATGLSFLGMYATYLLLVYRLAAWRTGFRWSKEAVILFGAGVLAASVVMLLSHQSHALGAGGGLLAGSSFGVNALVTLAKHNRAGAGRLEKSAAAVRSRLQRMGIWRHK